jgi:DNA-binding beta-propeller fold protein YncE
MRRRAIGTLIAFLIVALANWPGRAQDNRGVRLNPDVRVSRRVALVIANANYPGSPLRNSLNDAKDVSAALQALGFTVATGFDLTRRQMDEITARFSSGLQAGDLALFYYAGHGIQFNQENYLLPVDFQAASASDVQYNAIPAAQVRDRMEESGARLRILILDACRNNPFRATRGRLGGLAAMSSQVEGTLIAYATADNSTADDGTQGRNGLYTKCLLDALRSPGVTLKRWFENARDRVWEESSHRQRPYTYDGIVGDLALTPKVNPAGAGAPLLSFSSIETFAGRDWRFEGDGKSALEVALGHVYGVACDRAGNIYATDAASQAVVKIDRAGKLKILAGPDSTAYRPINPRGIAVDSVGVVYFTTGLHVRKLLADGQAPVIAGGARSGFTPDGAPAAGSLTASIEAVAIAPDGTVVFSEPDNHRVRRINAQGRLETVAGDGQARFAGDGGPAQQASLNSPMQIAFDPQGNLFIADRRNGRVRKVTPDGIITTVAGGGTTQHSLGCPMGVAANQKNDLFIADPCQRLVLMVRDGHSSVIAGTGRDHKEPEGVGGPAVSASLDEWALAVTPQDELLVSAPDNGYVYKIGGDGILSIVAGTGGWRAPVDGTKAADAVFQFPNRLALAPGGALLLTDRDANRIYRIQNGVMSRVAGFAGTPFLGENTLAKETGLNSPTGIRVRPNGAIVYAERGSNRIREISPDGKVRTLAGNGQANYSGDGGPAAKATLNTPVGLCIDAAGAVYFTDLFNNRVRKITPQGTIELVAGNGARGFRGDGGPAERAAFNTPTGIEVAPDGSLFIADTENHRVRKVSTDGVITTIAGNGEDRFAGDGGPALDASLSPWDLAFGPDHALYVVDQKAGRIRRIEMNTGIIDTVAGNGSGTSSGDGGSPPSAGLAFPRGLTFDSSGNLYVTEASRIRIIRIGSQRVAAGRGGQPIREWRYVEARKTQ